MINQNSNFKKRSLCGLLLSACVFIATAADDLYQNDSVLGYTIPPQILPTINATNFVNNSIFNITFTAPFGGFNAETFEPGDTLNYTNNGTMVANSSFLTNSGALILNFNPGCGFLFDHYSTGNGLHSPANSFYNPGTIRANSFIDLTNFFFFVSTIGKVTINATNVVNPGTIELGFDSLLDVTGQDVDFSRGTVAIDNFNSFFFNFFGFVGVVGGNAGVSGIDFGVGTDTNQDWDPSLFLQPTIAVSSLFQSQSAFFNQMVVNPSTPYFHEDDQFDPVTGLLTHRLVRAVFLNNNPGTNVAASVYFGGNPFPFLGPGFVTVGWAGTYRDPGTGVQMTNYLYLNDFYLRGANTNNPIFNGVPSNFTFTELNTPAQFAVGPDAPAFPVITPPGVVTNNYSYVMLKLTPVTVATNAGLSNPSGALTNLPGRVQFNASGTLDLSQAKISGLNYVALTCSNQFQGSSGAQIFSPYADINLGVTNGFMVVSNLLEPSLPSWDGTVQAWSSDWTVVDAAGVTNEYRVLLVNANVAPATPTEVQHLILHATNDLVISDVLNVFGKFSIDAQNLTLTVNDPGAASLQGELNLQTSTNNWQTSTRYLHNLTNNGAIRLSNFSRFGISSTNSVVVTNVTPGSAATSASGTLSEITGKTNVTTLSLITIGTNKYTFVIKLTNAIPNQVHIEKTFDGTMSNLIAAINHGAGPGTAYSTNSPLNPYVTAGLLTGHAFTVVSKFPGTVGNSIATTYTPKANTHGVVFSNATWNGHVTLFGGVNGTAPVTNVTVVPVAIGGRYGALINNGVMSDQGSVIFVDNFVNSGAFLNGIGSFTLNSLTTTLTNGSITAAADISITASSMVASNVFIEADRSLTLKVTNLLTDTGIFSSNYWVVGLNSVGNGISLPIKPPVGDLLGTTITNYAPAGKKIANIWSGQDFGASVTGYTNNLAVGHLVLDALGTAPSTQINFTGAGVNNALYVDRLELLGGVEYNSHVGTTLPGLFITNLVIYYADAVSDGIDVSLKLDGFNGNHLRWVPSYVGAFSSSNVISSSFISHLALAGDSSIDSDGDGIHNASDATPFFEPGMVNLIVYPTNNPPNRVVINWMTPPHATNSVLYSTNLVTWQVLTNFITQAPIPGPAVNVKVFDPTVGQGRYYQVIVSPWLMYPF